MWLYERSGLGVVLRDESGVVLAIRAMVVSFIKCTGDAEGMPIKLGMCLALSLGLEKILIETDSSQVWRRPFGMV